ncbi:sugar phosphate isomerase/epimerase family protein [Mucilaginibacter sp. P25]|uniref:Sugar phosphate isomerase/epimerase n=1 Tax=Mucilaginibacter gossypii TaxID=551996 RepID=A0A1G7YPH8_9SPHI|nr:sugar phosphate isomerase/epimerase [Mucilaginibacter gossypii]SDG98347.1 Sugar phosphate isomerase/epimerase [Mucilaginibacter gossypii]
MNTNQIKSTIMGTHKKALKIIILAIFLSPISAIAQRKNFYPLIPSLNAYSFSDLLTAKDNRDKQPVYSIFNLLDWCASQNIKGLDPTAYFFPSYPNVPSDEYLKRFKEKATQLGIKITGTGIRNNFASPDPKVRAEGLQLAKDWIVAASKMGAPVVRVFSGDIPKGYENKWGEVAGWMIDCYKQCATYAQRYGVKIGIQNHGDMLQTADQCLYVLKAVDSKWVGLIVDTGNFKTEDPYEDISKVVPFAINWQIKESPFGIGGTVPTDYLKLIKIIKAGGYTGYLPVETLLVRGRPYDPFESVPEMLNKLQAAIKQVYN